MTKHKTLKVGQFLYFVPPRFADGDKGKKSRPMLIVTIEDDKLWLINISSIKKNNPRDALHPSNHRIMAENPPPKPSYAKLDVIYVVERFDGIEEFLWMDEGLEELSLKLIQHKLQTEFYKNVPVIFSTDEFKKYNPKT